MKILILASYTKEQKYKPDNRLTREDRENPDPAYLDLRIEELRDYRARAGEMFTGQFHVQLREGLRQIRRHERYGETTLDLYFPWYFCRVDGEKRPVNEKDIIVPFDIVPSHEARILEYNDGGIPERMSALIEPYDLVFSLLRREDIRLLQRVFEMERATPLIFLIAQSNGRYIPDNVPNVHVVYTADLVGQIDGVSNYNHQGAVFRKLCEAAYHQGLHIFEEVKQAPQRLLEIVCR